MVDEMCKLLRERAKTGRGYGYYQISPVPNDSSTSKVLDVRLVQLTVNTKDDQARVEGIFAAFNESWLVYWDAYVELQNQLYESVKAAREVSWLAATDTDQISRINMAQRELFASMPRRMDYSPLGDIRNMDNAMRRLQHLEDTMVVEKTKCLKLIDAIEVIRGKIAITKQGLQTKP